MSSDDGEALPAELSVEDALRLENLHLRERLTALQLERERSELHAALAQRYRLNPATDAVDFVTRKITRG